MRVAALYDIHANLPALEAVLAEVEREEPDVIVVGGDVALGPMPRETLDRLTDLGTRARFVRGNTDRELLEIYRGASPFGRPHENVWVRLFAWAAGEITDEHASFLESFEGTIVLELDGLGPALFCHGSPRSDEEGITALTTEATLDEMLAETRERLVVCGHTHVQLDRAPRGTRVVNAGSVGLPAEELPGAYWLLLGPGVELRRTEYDLADAAERIRASGCPDPDALLARLGIPR